MPILVLPPKHETKLQPRAVYGLMYGINARCYLKALDPNVIALMMTIRDNGFLMNIV